MAGTGFRDWIPDTPEVIAKVKAEGAEKKAAKKAAMKGLKVPAPVVVEKVEQKVAPVAPKAEEGVKYGPEDLDRDSLLKVAKKQGLEVKGNISKEELVSKLKAKVKSHLTK